MPRQSTLDTAYLKIAKEWSNLSQALRKKVGCIIVKKGAIISDGYNGTPAGFSNRCLTSFPMNKGQGVKVRNLFLVAFQA